MLATIWTKEKGLSYDREVEVIAVGVGVFCRYAIVLDENTGKLEKVRIKKLKVIHRF